MERLNVPPELVAHVDQFVAQRALFASDHHLKSVRPVVIPDDGGAPDPIGSCVLLEIGPKRFAITAAHVFDNARGRAIYIGGIENFTEVTSVRQLSAPPCGDREKDKLDVGFVELSTTNAVELGDCRFLTVEDVAVNECPTFDAPGRSKYLALGYPIRKAGTDQESGKFNPVPFRFTSYAVRIDPHYAKMDAADHSHILLHFPRKRVRSVEGQQTYVKPNGISGGGLWTFPSLASLRVADNKLVGILIEYKEGSYKAIMAARITLSLEAIRLRYPELSPLIPASSQVHVNARSVPPTQS